MGSALTTYGQRVCGRYAASRSPDSLVMEYAAEDGTAGEAPVASYNVAPTQPVLVVRPRVRDGRRELSVARWGLVPSWSADTRSAGGRINARAETVGTTPAFRAAFRHRRCLVPADGWFEWVPDGSGRRRPYFLTPADGRGLAFAGLWEVWGEDARLLTMTIVTTAAVGRLTEVHHRMPVILGVDRHTAWLDPATSDPAQLLTVDDEVLAGLEIRPVGPRVGSVANHGPDLVARAETAEHAPPLPLW